MKKKLSLVKTKYRADGALITSVLVITVIAIMLLFFIDLYSDMKIKDHVDMVARKYIIILETTNTLNVDKILDDVALISGVDKDTWEVTVTVQGAHSYTVTKKTGLIELTSGTQVGYGDEITLTLRGNVVSNTGRWEDAFDTSKDPTMELHVSRSSTSKH